MRMNFYCEIYPTESCINSLFPKCEINNERNSTTEDLVSVCLMLSFLSFENLTTWNFIEKLEAL